MAATGALDRDDAGVVDMAEALGQHRPDEIN